MTSFTTSLRATAVMVCPMVVVGEGFDETLAVPGAVRVVPDGQAEAD
jgi:hypothetical protein